MFVPIVPHTTVENKTIVYSDTVLPLKNSGKKLKITCIPNVDEISLKRCLETIFQSNPNVIFNTVQYSKENQKVYFYANQLVSTKEFEESRVLKYQPISSHTQILEEVKKILMSDKPNDSDCISLYDLGVLISQMNQSYDSIPKKYDSQLNDMIKTKFGSFYQIAIDHFDYKQNELIIDLLYIGIDYISTSFGKIAFGKKDGDLYISKSETFQAQDIFTAIGPELSKLYDELICFFAYHEEKNDKVHSMNSNFLVSYNLHGVTLFVNSPKSKYQKAFELILPSYDKEQYRYKCNSTTLISALSGQESELFQRVFVKIDDCPKWSQSILYETRQKQLEEEQKKKEKMAKKQKRLERLSTLFPFLKK